jgi:hypothetical protein
MFSMGTATANHGATSSTARACPLDILTGIKVLLALLCLVNAALALAALRRRRGTGALRLVALRIPVRTAVGDEALEGEAKGAHARREGAEVERRRRGAADVEQRVRRQLVRRHYRRRCHVRARRRGGQERVRGTTGRGARHGDALGHDEGWG